MSIEKEISQDLAKWLAKNHGVAPSASEEVALVIELSLNDYKEHVVKEMNKNTGVSMTLYDNLGNEVECAK